MSVVKLTKRNSWVIGYEHSETIQDGENGNTIKIPPLQPGKVIACTLIAGSNSGKFQFSTALDADVLADTCEWNDWDNGTTTGSHTEVIVANVSAVRGVSVSGEIKIEIKI